MIPPVNDNVSRYHTPIWIVYTGIAKPKTEHENKKGKGNIDKKQFPKTITLRHIHNQKYAHNKCKKVGDKNNQ